MFASALIFFACVISAIADEQQAPTRTKWQYIRGPINPLIVNPAASRNFHGHIDSYKSPRNIIPDIGDSRWAPCSSQDSFCTHADIIGVASTSRLPDGYCLQYVDYTYYQTTVFVPAGVVVNTLKMTFPAGVMDDGVEVRLFNSLYPNGYVDANSYVYLWRGSTLDLAPHIVVGENRILLTQVDDCAVGNNINAAIELNGAVVPPTCRPANPCQTAVVNPQGVCTITNLPDGTSCSDSNLCTTGDTCRAGQCVGTPKVCDSECGYTGQCNPVTGLCPGNPSGTKCFCVADAPIPKIAIDDFPKAL